MKLFEQFKHCLNKSKQLCLIYTESVTEDGDENYSFFNVPCNEVSISSDKLMINVKDNYRMSFDVDWNDLVVTSCNEYSYVGNDSRGCLFWLQ